MYAYSGRHVEKKSSILKSMRFPPYLLLLLLPLFSLFEGAKSAYAICLEYDFLFDQSHTHTHTHIGFIWLHLYMCILECFKCRIWERMWLSQSRRVHMLQFVCKNVHGTSECALIYSMLFVGNRWTCSRCERILKANSQCQYLSRMALMAFSIWMCMISTNVLRIIISYLYLP